MTDENRKLLERFLFENEDLEKLEDQLSQYNIFEAIGVVSQELRHSDFLSYLLAPNLGHGLNDAFLKNLLKQVVISGEDSPFNTVEIDISNFKDAEIRREWRSIDILIVSECNNLVCVIENKVGSKEGEDQLKTYYHRISNHKKYSTYKQLYVYLTPSGEPASESDWISLSYSDICRMLENLIGRFSTSMGADIHTTISHYITMLRRHIVTDSDIAEICRKIYFNHKDALDLIFDHKPDLQLEISEYLKNLIDDNKQVGLVREHSTKNYIRFSTHVWDHSEDQMKGGGWTSSKKLMLFEFQNYESSLMLKLVIGPGETKIREDLFNVAKSNKKVFKGCLQRFTQKWTQIYKTGFLSKKDYEDPNIEDLKTKIESQFKMFLETELEAIMSKIPWSAT